MIGTIAASVKRARVAGSVDGVRSGPCWGPARSPASAEPPITRPTAGSEHDRAEQVERVDDVDRGERAGGEGGDDEPEGPGGAEEALRVDDRPIGEFAATTV